MTILGLPGLTRGNASQCAINLQPLTQSFESPLNRAVQTYELPGARWAFSATWSALSAMDARIFKAWLSKLRGAAGRFYAGDLANKTPIGSVNGHGHVYGAGQTGSTIITAWTGDFGITTDDDTITTDSDLITMDYGEGMWFFPGDYIGINGELKIVTEIASVEGGGFCTIVFEPPLRTSPPDSTEIIYQFPKTVFRLIDDKQDSFNFDVNRRPTITISAIEVLS